MNDKEVGQMRKGGTAGRRRKEGRTKAERKRRRETR